MVPTDTATGAIVDASLDSNILEDTETEDASDEPLPIAESSSIEESSMTNIATSQRHPAMRSGSNQNDTMAETSAVLMQTIGAAIERMS